MTGTTESSLRLLRLEIQNFCNVQSAVIDVNGNHLELSGPNGCGKSSVVNALWVAIKGVAQAEAADVIHHGADRAVIKVDLGELLIERVITRKSIKLTVTLRDGTRLASQQEVLNSLLGSLTLDPVTFLTKKPADQLEDLLAIAGVAPPVDAVRAIVGDTIPDSVLAAQPNESALLYLDRLTSERSGVVYSLRRDAGRALEQAEAALAGHRQALDKLGGPLQPGESEATAGELVQELAGLQKRSNQRRAVADVAAGKRKKHAEAVSLRAGLEKDVKREDGAIDQLQAQIAAMQRRLDERMLSRKALLDRIGKGTALIAELDADAAAAEEAVETLADPAPQIAAMTAKMAAAEAQNQRIIERRLLAQHLAAATKHRQEVHARHQQLSAVLDRIRQLNRSLLDGAELGIANLTIGEGEIRLGGAPLRLASRAEQIRLAVALAMKQNPRLKFIRLDEAERLDAASKQIVRELADRNGFQIISARVADSGPLRIEITDKEAT